MPTTNHITPEITAAVNALFEVLKTKAVAARDELPFEVVGSNEFVGSGEFVSRLLGDINNKFVRNPESREAILEQLEIMHNRAGDIVACHQNAETFFHLTDLACLLIYYDYPQTVTNYLDFCPTLSRVLGFKTMNSVDAVIARYDRTELDLIVQSIEAMPDAQKTALRNQLFENPARRPHQGDEPSDDQRLQEIGWAFEAFFVGISAHRAVLVAEAAKAPTKDARAA